MAAESDADRLIFIDPGSFGVEAVYTPKNTGVPGEPITGILDQEGKLHDPNRWMGGPEYTMQTGAHFQSAAPTFECRKIDLPDSGRQGSRLTADGETYRVQAVKPDGTGMVILVLVVDD